MKNNVFIDQQQEQVSGNTRTIVENAHRRECCPTQFSVNEHTAQ